MLFKKFKQYFVIAILAIFIGSFLPGIIAETLPHSGNNTNNLTVKSDLTEIFDEYLILIDYNEPMNPYIIMIYYYKDGSCSRIVFGIESVELHSLNLENKLIPVFDADNNFCGHGVKTRASSNLYIYIKSN